MSETPANWYPDGTGQLRYWDGYQWTEHTHPMTDAATDGNENFAPVVEEATVEETTVEHGAAEESAADQIDVETSSEGFGFQPANFEQVAAPVQAASEISSLPYLRWTFKVSAGSFFGVCLLSLLLMIFTLGIATPWAIVMLAKWQATHTYINGHKLRFTGSGGALFGRWLLWWFLGIITLGIYYFWAIPKMVKWLTEHQELDPVSAPYSGAGSAGY